MPNIKRVALIEPKPPGYHVFSGIALPRLGLPLLGAMLKRRGIEASVHCQDILELDYPDILGADLVGISTTTSTAPEAYRIARHVRSAGIPVVLGGSHVSFMADEALEHADFCVRGEGEYTMMELLDAIESGSGFGSIAGLSYKIGDEVRHNPARPLVRDLDSLPFPDLSLIKGSDRIGITPVATSRGCPFDCSFCSVTQMFGRKFRQRGIDNVIDELKLLNPDKVFFYDDNFTADRERSKRLLERMLSEGITPNWTAQARVDVVRDRELLKLMKRSNCYMLYLGLESVNPATLNEYHKRQSVEEIVEALRILHEHGIMTHGMFVFGADNDDIASLRNTVGFALRNRIDTVQFLILTPLPGTAYYDGLVKSGRLLTQDWHLYDGQHVVHRPEKISPYDLQKETFRAMKRFYSLGECVKMLCGLNALLSVTRFNLNLLMGRWSAAKRHLNAAVLRGIYRAYGHVLLRRWEAANKGFGEQVKSLTKSARVFKPVSPTVPKRTD